MKAYILKRERILHVLSLLAIVASVFLKEINMKIVLLAVGIIGLTVISAAKGNKTTTAIYALLLILAFVGFFLIDSGTVKLPTY